MRLFRRRTEPAILRKLRAQRKKENLEALFVERYLQETYEAVDNGGNELVPMNLHVVKSSCSEFNVKNSFCRICQFHSERKQREKFGKVCPVWYTVFGTALKKAVINLTLKEHIKVTPRFIEMWNARKANIPNVIPKQIQMMHVPNATQKRAKKVEETTGISFYIVGS